MRKPRLKEINNLTKVWHVKKGQSLNLNLHLPTVEKLETILLIIVLSLLTSLHQYTSSGYLMFESVFLAICVPLSPCQGLGLQVGGSRALQYGCAIPCSVLWLRQDPELALGSFGSQISSQLWVGSGTLPCGSAPQRPQCPASCQQRIFLLPLAWAQVAPPAARAATSCSRKPGAGLEGASSPICL